MTLPGDLDKKIAELSPAKRALLDRLRKKGAGAAPPPITARPKDSAIPLSFAQQRLWFLYELDPSSTLYNVPRALRLKGALDIDALQESLNLLVSRHEVLRTRFAMTANGPEQIVVPHLTLPLPETDLSATPFNEQEVALRGLALQDVKQPFDLANGPVLRARLFRLGDQDHVLLIVLHHIVSDGWTGGIFFDELGVLYNATVEKKSSPLTKPALQYADYAIWQRNWLQGEVLEGQMDYWRSQLKGTATELVLPADRVRPSLPSYRGSTESVLLGDLSEKIKTFSQEKGTTVFVTMLAALKILLFRWTRQSDLVVGTITANRNQLETERMLGCFMNFLALRSQLAEKNTGAEILEQEKQTVLQAYAHQECPFDKLIEEINPERKLNVNPLYNVSFQFQNFRPFEFAGSSLDAHFVDLKTDVAFLDLRFIGEETPAGLRLECEFSTDLFERETIRLLLLDYVTTIERFIAHPEEALASFALLPALEARAERARKLQEKRTIAVAATFTAEPLQESLAFWMQELGVNAAVTFAPYNQVFQQLLNPSSLLATNHEGLNVVLIRAQDFIASEAGSSEQNVRELRTALEKFARSRVSPLLVGLCPSSASADVSGTETLLIFELSEVDGLHLLTAKDVQANYPVENWEDPYSNKLGRIPYTGEFFAALGTSIVRKIRAMQCEPYQVIVLAADNGPIDRSLQEFVAVQSDAGMLLCLTSARNEEDAFAAFDPTMPLRREHFVASSTGQGSAADGLKALAEELQIGLERFIYIDRNASDCAEVQATCPEVLALLLPRDHAQIPSFLNHVWAFDRAETIDPHRGWSVPASGIVTNRIANEFRDVSRISRAIESKKKRAVSGSEVVAAPTTQIEELLAGIWERLLHLEKVGIHDDFFALGGHSLLATQLLARIRQQFRIELPLRSIFEAPTVAGLAALVEQQVRAGEGLSIPPILPVSRDRRLPLSFAQQRLWFLDLLEPGNTTFNLPQLFRMKGSLNASVLARSLNEIVRRHEALRTAFAVEDNEPYQVIKPELNIDLPLVDLTRLPENDRPEEAQRLVMQEAQGVFDLKTGPVVRAKIFRLSASEHWLLLNTHHIASDRWSMGLFSEELAALYKAFAGGQPSPLPELIAQYADYAVWQRAWLQGEALQKQLGYWEEQLRGAPASLELPTDNPRPPVPTYRGSIRTLVLPAELVAKLSDLCQREGVTQFMALLAAFDTLMFRYTGQEDIVVGSPIANRTRAEVEPIIGFFINTLALRARLSPDQSFSQLLSQIRGVALEGYAHQDLPFERLVEGLHLERSLSYNPIFQVMFALQNAPMQALELPGIRLERAPVFTGTSMFDMSWYTIEVPEGLLLRAEYSTDLFEASTVDRMLEHFHNIVEAVVGNPQLALSRIPLQNLAERTQILVDRNATEAPFAEQCIHSLFELQVEKTPDAIAVTFADKHLTYAQLNARANQLAHFLRKLGVGPDVLVGLCVERSPEMVVGLLGILKAGGAYIPLDPAYPKDRITYILEDAHAPVLITDESLAEVFSDGSAKVVRLDSNWIQIAAESEANLSNAASTHNLAYVIYTSGSTGKPKGVQLEHRSVANFLESMRVQPGMTADDVLLAVTTLSFDIAGLEIYLPLTTGARVVIASREETVDGHLLLDRMQQCGATVMQATPATWRMLLDAGWDRSPRLKILCGGEALPRELADQVLLRCSSLWNMYGPTETTIWSSVLKVEEGGAGTVSIGRPIANTQMYILDRHMAPVPDGVSGELYIGGDGLARGYFNRPELTAEKFVPDPFRRKPGARLYRTGDLARYLPDGTIAFLGRSDFQVKLRGHRIELGEIEAALTQHSAIRQAVVAVREDKPGDQRLVAYMVGVPVDAAELKNHLRESLPDYMIPSVFMMMESLPLTPNGKIDRKALPIPEYQRDASADFVAPQNPLEQTLAGIFCQVLHLEKVGTTDDFFSLGGHSLLATQVISRIRQALQVELPLRTVFEAPTIAGLAARIEKLQSSIDTSDASAIPRADRSQPLPLSFAQQRLWFLDQLEPDNPLYNIPWSLRLSGSLNAVALERSIHALTERHETLRTTFATAADKPVQVIAPQLRVPLSIVDLSQRSVDEQPAEVERFIQSEAKRPFDLKNGPLLRAKLLRLAEQDHVLLLNIHHIISDRWSMGVLSKELASLYAAEVEGKPASLPGLSVQYADFSVWQRQWLESGVLEEQLDYWKQQLKDAPPVLELPTDRPRRPVETFRGAVRMLEIPYATAEALNALCRRHGSTLFMALLAGFQALLSRYSGQQDIVVGTPVAGRNRAEIEGLIGFFANTLAMRLRFSDDPNFETLFGRAKEAALGAYANQDVPFEKLVEELRPGRSLSHNPLVQVFFVLQNAPLETLQLTGLSIATIETDTKTAKGDLFFSLVETPSGLRGRMEYNTDLYDEATIGRMLEHYQVLLEAAVANPALPVSELPLLTRGERQQLLGDWNATDFDYPRELCLHELFEQQVERAPDAVACVHDGQSLTYAELNQRANQLAHFLKQRGVGPGQRIGLFVERSLPMMVGLLGIQKSGAAYVPLDPSYPAERLRLTLDDAQVPVLLTQESLSSSMPEHQAEVVCLDSDWRKIAAHSMANPKSGATPEDLVYVIFTSGSTGRPKGVQVPHRAVVNLLTFMAAELRMGPDDVFPALASFAFDMCIPELYLALVSGGRVIIGDRHLAANGEALAEVLRATGATIVHATPTTWNLLLEAGFTGKGLKRVIGAEALPRELCTRLLEADASLYNFYGPTETTVWSAFHHFRSPEEPIVVGRPLANTRIYILDPHGQPVPVGVPGEIHIAGDGVTCGYLNRPELTAEKFVRDPFSSSPNAKMYRTGDLGRFLADGRIEFEGRIDNQVKVRGYRIELGEIETVLGQHPTVQECVVVAREDVPGDKRLVGYVVPVAGQSPNVTELRAWVKERVPEYMTPVAFVRLERFPLSPNGKVDRKHLPAPDYVRPELGRAYLEARTPAEEVIAGIWAEVLKLDQVGIEDDFFELGGHSLLATQVVSRIRQAFQVELPLRAMFEVPTVAGLAERTEALQRQKQGLQSPPMTRVSRDEPLPLSFAQQRLWFLDQLEPNNPLYNVPHIVRLRGALHAAVLEKTLNEIVRRHETLRTRFDSIDDQPVQVIAPTMTLPLVITDLTSLPESEREAEARKRAMEEVKTPFNLATGPLLRATLIKLADDDHVLILNTHHIISDRWSLGVLSQELAALYEAYLADRPSPLTDLPIQYADYAVWQRQYLSGATLDQQLDYWKQQLAGAPPTLDLPTDRPRQAIENFWGGVYKQLLPEDLVKDLRLLSRRTSATFFMTLLAGFQILLARWSSQDDVVVGTDLANRTQLDTEKLIGFFVNVLPIRTRFANEASFEEILKQVREAGLGAFAHQDLPFDKLVEELRPERSLTHNPLVQVLFVMQNTPQMVKEFGGLKLGPLGVSSTSRFDLVLFINDPDGTPYATWMYNPNLFDEATIVRVASLYRALLTAVAADSGTKLDALREILADAEKQQRQAQEKHFEETSLQKLRNVKRKAVTRFD